MNRSFVAFIFFAATGVLASERSYVNAYVPNPPNPPKNCKYLSDQTVFFSEDENPPGYDGFLLMSCNRETGRGKFWRLWWWRGESPDFGATPPPVYNRELRVWTARIHVFDEVLLPWKPTFASLYRCNMKNEQRSKAIAALPEPKLPDGYSPNTSSNYKVTRKNSYGAWRFDEDTKRLSAISVDKIECDISEP